MIRAILIDDEKSERELLSDLLDMHCPDVQIVGQAEGVSTGVEVINEQKPDLVFLDIKMKDGTGFNLLNKLEDTDFKIIFITAYEEHAVKAIKFSALDYILKPIDPDELLLAVDKVRKSMEKDNLGMQMDAFVSNIEGKSKKEKKIVLKTADSIHLVNVENIIRCEAERNYTNFIFNDNKKLLVSKTLKEFEELLEGYGFFRVHQSHLVNLDYIQKYEKKDSGLLILSDGSRIPVSHRKKEQLMTYFANL